MSVIKEPEPAVEDSTSKDQIDYEDATEVAFRTLSILSYFVVLVLLGIPIWWYTTRVYRASLPLDEIYDLQLQANKSSDFGILPSLDYDVLISFVHPNPEDLYIEADAEEIDDYLQDLLGQLAPVADFVVKSQWLYLTELGAVPRKVLDHYALLENQLPHVITPLETKLWSHISSRPSINLVVYFPHCKSPLYIYDSRNELSSTNAFVSPRWGGIYIMNPDKQSCELGRFLPDSKLVASTFQQILREVLGLNDTSVTAIEQFKSRKIQEMLESSKRTLKSLAQLLSEINSIVISDKVADKIKLALESVLKAEADQKNSLLYAKLAFKNSEEAFAHPSLLALLYFPDDQKYAIYIPLFLPVMIPVVMSLTQLRKRRNKRVLKQKAE